MASFQAKSIFLSMMDNLDPKHNNHIETINEPAISKLRTFGETLPCNVMQCVIDKILNNDDPSKEPESNILLQYSNAHIWITFDKLDKFKSFFNINNNNLIKQICSNTFVEIIISSDYPIIFTWVREPEYFSIEKYSYKTRIVGSLMSKIEYLKENHNQILSHNSNENDIEMKNRDDTN